MANKALLGGFSVILVVAVVVGVVATVGRLSNNGPISTNVSIKSSSDSNICANAYYKDSCNRILSTAVNSSSSPIDIAKAVIEATVKEVSIALQSTQQFGSNYSDDKIKHTMIYCTSLFQESINLLEVSIEEAGSFQKLVQNSDQLSHWIGAVTSLTEGCVDVLFEPELKKRVDSTLVNTREFATNAISILELLVETVKELPDIQQQLKGFDFSSIGRRRLLQDQEIDGEGYPNWLSAGDRKLLAAARPAGRGRRGAGGKWRLKPNFVVAQDGSGNFRTIKEAIKAVPSNAKTRTVIYVKAGVYREQVLIPADKVNVYMYGDGGRKTIVTANKCHTKGQEIDTNPTFAVEGKGTILRWMKFENTAGPEGEQAVALRVKADMVAVLDCHLYAYQDTLYAHAYRQFYGGCIIAGTIDFIFGDASMILQKCTILLRNGGTKTRNYMTASGRTSPKSPTGIVIHDCQILPDKDLEANRLQFENYLGRPWKQYARVVIMQSFIGDLIRPEGYYMWKGSNFEKTATYIEFNNNGPGANTAGRVKWSGVKSGISPNEAMGFTAGSPFLGGSSWLPGTGAKFLSGLKR